MRGAGRAVVVVAEGGVVGRLGGLPARDGQFRGAALHEPGAAVFGERGVVSELAEGVDEPVDGLDVTAGGAGEGRPGVEPAGLFDVHAAEVERGVAEELADLQRRLQVPARVVEPALLDGDLSRQRVGLGVGALRDGAGRVGARRLDLVEVEAVPSPPEIGLGQVPAAHLDQAVEQGQGLGAAVEIAQRAGLAEQGDALVGDEGEGRVVVGQAGLVVFDDAGDFAQGQHRGRPLGPVVAGALVVELGQGRVFLRQGVLPQKELHLRETRLDGLDGGQPHLVAGAPGAPVAHEDRVVVGGERLAELGRLFGEPVGGAVQAEIEIGGEGVGGDQRLQHRVPGVAVAVGDGAGVDVLLDQVFGRSDIQPRGRRRDR